MGAYTELFGLKDKAGNEYKLLVGVNIKNGIQVSPIIPEKKKLPKTKEELICLIQDAIIQAPHDDIRLSLWINSFLKEYEF